MLLLVVVAVALLSTQTIHVDAYAAAVSSYSNSTCTALVQTLRPTASFCVQDIIDTTKYMTVTCADSTATSAWTINTVASSTCIGLDTQQASGSDWNACVAFNGNWVKVRNRCVHSKSNNHHSDSHQSSLQPQFRT